MMSTRIMMERVLLALGMTLLAVYVAGRVHATMLSRLAVQSFELSLPRPSATERPHHRRGSFPVEFSLWSQPRIEAYKQSLVQHLESPIAILRVTTIKLEVPVLNGTDELTLNRGAGWISGTSRPGERGNIGIAGHRDGFFRGLKDLKLGDAIDLVTRNGTETYEVDQMRVVSPDNVSVLQPTSNPSLTLVTCYPFYFVGSAPSRYIVHALRIRFQPLSADGGDTLGFSRGAKDQSENKMNSPRRTLPFGMLAVMAFCLALAVSASTQVKTETNTSVGSATTQVTVERGEVVSVNGNDLIVKMEDGSLRHFANVPESARVTVDGKELGIHDLKPGMKLQRTITTTTTPKTITTVQTVTGTVWQVAAPNSVTLRLEDGTTQRFHIPKGQKFTINGQETDAFGLRQGMKISATKVVEEPQTIVEHQQQVTGTMPAPPTPPPPDQPILIAVVRVPVPAPAAESTAAAAAEPTATQKPAALPKTGSELPLVGLLGVSALAIGLGLRAIRLMAR